VIDASPGREDGCDLEGVIATEQLEKRATRIPDGRKEAEILLRLSRELSQAPEEFFSKLVVTAMELSHADSAGISLLNEAEGCFVWPTVAGGLSPHVQEGTPRNFGPCGTVLDRDQTLLMVHPERYFAYLAPITPSLEEVLLIPFYMDDKAVGTIWAVIHEAGRNFDREDRRLLEGLSVFASAAYKALASADLLEPFLKRKDLI
jgi:hypothetical protein